MSKYLGQEEDKWQPLQMAVEDARLDGSFTARGHWFEEPGQLEATGTDLSRCWSGSMHFQNPR